MSRLATSLIFQSASPSWDEPLANQLSSNSPTPSNKAQRFVAPHNTSPLHQELDRSRRGGGRAEEGGDPCGRPLCLYPGFSPDANHHPGTESIYYPGDCP